MGARLKLPKPLRLRRYKTFSNFFEKSIDISG